MPVKYSLVDNIHFVCLDGEFSHEELLQAAGKMRAQVQGPAKIFIDARRSTAYFSHEFIYELASGWRPPEGSRYAIVVSKPNQYGVANMFASYRAGHGIQAELFFDYDAALNWIKS